jgi:hypothetical protein
VGVAWDGILRQVTSRVAAVAANPGSQAADDVSAVVVILLGLSNIL